MLNQDVLNELNRTIDETMLSAGLLADLNRTISKNMLGEDVLSIFSDLQQSIDQLYELSSFASKDDLSIATDAGRRAGINGSSNPTEHGLTHIEVLESSGANPYQRMVFST